MAHKQVRKKKAYEKLLKSEGLAPLTFPDELPDRPFAPDSDDAAESEEQSAESGGSENYSDSDCEISDEEVSDSEITFKDPSLQSLWSSDAAKAAPARDARARLAPAGGSKAAAPRRRPSRGIASSAGRRRPTPAGDVCQ